MKSNAFKLVALVIFLFAVNMSVLRAGNSVDLYHNVEKMGNTVATTYYKNDGNSGLAPFKKKINIQNEAGLCVSKVTYVWNATANDWLPVDKMDYVYDGENVINVERCTWNTKIQDWDNLQQTSYSHTENGALAK